MEVGGSLTGLDGGPGPSRSKQQASLRNAAFTGQAELGQECGAGSNFCCLCNRHESHSHFTGDVKFYNTDGIKAHHLCLLFSSGLPQDGDKKNGLGGFAPEKVVGELRRLSRLKCAHCGKRGAGMGCAVSRCRSSFHYPCGLEADALLQYRGKFGCLCKQHRPRVTFSQEYLESDNCAVCLEKFIVVPVPGEDGVFQAQDPFTLVKMKCCKKALMHRNCLLNMALASGYHFKCPLCNNADKGAVKAFQKSMRMKGIFVPRKDAGFEEEGNMENGAQRGPVVRCEIQDCLFAGCDVPRLKRYAEDLTTCSFECGRAVHLTCVGLEEPPWACDHCKDPKKPRESFRRIRPTLAKIYDANPQSENGKITKDGGKGSVMFQLLSEKFADKTTGVIPPLEWPDQADDNRFPFARCSRSSTTFNQNGSPVKKNPEKPL